MADTVTSKTLMEGSKHIEMLFTNDSDGTGESAVVKVDFSSLSGLEGRTLDKVAIDAVEWAINGFNFVKIAFDATTDDTMLVLSGTGYMEFPNSLSDPQSTGYTGDIVFTTDGGADGSSYTIKLHMTKSYA